jgi:ABC-2 type transport system permease protein
MDLQNVLAVASKDFAVTRRRKSIMGYTIGLPFLLFVSFSLLMQNQIQTAAPSGALPTTIGIGFEALVYVFVILAATIPTTIAAYSIVGEKTEKSLEPLLATPMTDQEILFGKALAAFVPPVLATWAGALLYMVASNAALYDAFSVYYFPTWTSSITFFLLIPLAALTGVEVAVIVSSRVGDVRGASQVAGLMWLPFMALFVAGVTGAFPYTVFDLLAASGVLVVTDMLLFYASTSLFQREEILTKWR